VVLPFEPFPGTIASPLLSRAAFHRPAVTMGRQHGHQAPTRGTTLLLPVGVEGALFSVGRPHAAMGDAEVCGTAVETAMDITLRLSLRRDSTFGAAVPDPRRELARTNTRARITCAPASPPTSWKRRGRRRARSSTTWSFSAASTARSVRAVLRGRDLRIHEVVDVPELDGRCLPADDIFTT
jgi:acetamidase/formamidase